jgi:peptidoglycan glycosyltransferase
MSGVTQGRHHEAPGIGAALLRVAGVLFVGYLAVVVGAGWWQLVRSGPLTDDPRDPLRAWVDRNIARGRILDSRGALVVGNTRSQDGSRARRYRFPAMATITGYHSLLLGTAGLERSFDLQLSGMDGLTAGGGALRKLRDQPYRPVDLVLSVDARFQQLAARLLGDRRGAVVAIEPSSGRILALVSSPTFDPGRLADPGSARAYLARLRADDEAPLLDRATQGLYVPGSVFKLVTAVAALGSGAVDADTTFASQPAESRRGLRIDGTRIHDAPRTVQLDEPLVLADAMEVSSNVWFARAALEAGPEAMVEAARRMRLDAVFDIGLPAVAGQVNGDDGDLAGFGSEIELASAGFGQGEVLVTPLHMAVVAATIANDGVLMAPSLVDRMEDDDGRRTERAPRAVGRVMSPDVADAIRVAMTQAVEGKFAGPYAGGAKVPGVRTAGKSGTAQLAAGERPHGWFVGFAPADAPRIAIAVVVENGGAGSTTAVPLGGRLMRAWLERFDPKR